METFFQLAKVQPIAIKMIKKMIETDRIAHAYVIHGEPGTRKRAIAHTFAMRLFCQETTSFEPCMTCDHCVRIKSLNHPDFHVIKKDGASIKKEQIELLQKEFVYGGKESNRKVYIIEDADLMTHNAANRLLKFLEEPNQETTAFLITNNQQQLLHTIRSRCQSISVRPLSGQMLEDDLVKEGVSKANARLFRTVAPLKEDALALNEDEWFATARQLLVKFSEILIKKPHQSLLFMQTKWMPHFSDREKLMLGLELLLIWFRDLISIMIDDLPRLILLDNQTALKAACLHYTKDELTTILTKIAQSKQKLRQNIHPTLVMEQLTLQMQR